MGSYVASEAHQAVLPARWKADGTRRGVVFCHGLGGVATTYQTWNTELRTLALHGFPVISTDLGGTDTWGNDTSQTRIGQAWTYLKSTLGAKTDKMILHGVSMGALSALNYLRANPSNVAAVTGVVPATNLVNMHDNAVARGVTEASIDAAYTDHAGYDAAKATHDPAQNLAAHEAISVPVKFWYATDDATCPQAEVLAFDSAVTACSLTSLGAVGHTGYPAVLNHYQVQDFLLPYSA